MCANLGSRWMRWTSSPLCFCTYLVIGFGLVLSAIAIQTRYFSPFPRNTSNISSNTNTDKTVIKCTISRIDEIAYRCCNITTCMCQPWDLNNDSLTCPICPSSFDTVNSSNASLNAFMCCLKGLPPCCVYSKKLKRCQHIYSRMCAVFCGTCVNLIHWIQVVIEPTNAIIFEKELLTNCHWNDDYCFAEQEKKKRLLSLNTTLDCYLSATHDVVILDYPERHLDDNKNVEIVRFFVLGIPGLVLIAAVIGFFIDALIRFLIRFFFRLVTTARSRL